MKLHRFFPALLAVCLPLALPAQNTVFNDSFAGDSLNPASYPAVTATTTGWQVLSNKAAPAPTESGGVLTINMAGTTSGFIETQALFASAPVQLLPGTYIELTTTFVPTFVLTNPSDNLIVGLFNSGGTAPIAGLLNSGLSNALTTFATGGAKGWLGYNANLPLTGTAPRVVNRPAQTGTNNTVQDVVVGGQSSSVGYTVPAGTNASNITAFSTTLVNDSTYTLDYKLALSADGLTLTSTVSLYNGAGITGTGSNALVGSYSGRFTGTAVLTKAFDALAIGWRADAGGSSPSNLKLNALTVKTTGGTPWFTAQPPPAIAVSIGSDLNLAASVGGTVNTYQWQVSTDGGANYVNLDPVANPSAATATLLLTNVQFANAGLYRLVATNAAGVSASSPCTVTVSATPVAPAISTNPSGATVLGGTPYTFTFSVNGTSPLSYQWEKSTDGVTFVPVAGATSAAYTIPSVSLSDEGYYHVVVTNVAGSATSTAAQLIVNQPLTITVQPVGAALDLGSNYTLSATAVGRPAPTYQWYLNGGAIVGATDANYVIASAAAANAGIYTVVASNSTGDSVTSSGAAVAVLSSTLATTTLTPSSTPTGIAPDTRLTLTFNQPIFVGSMGKIRIFDASNPTIPVDTIDLIAGTALMKTLRAAGAASTQLLPVQNKTVGGLTNFNYYPITVSGNTATIYPRNNVLGYGKNYFVTIEPGVFTDSTGLSFAGISSNSGWTFLTKAAAPASTSTQLVIAADGSGDFYTVQGALDFIPAGNTTPRTLLIRRGTYFEQIYFNGKHSLTFLGEDRAQSMIVYPNNNTFNNVSGSYHRMTVQADKANNVAFVNLTIQNSTPKGGSQAEALILNGTTTAQAIVSNVTLFSYQDTLQVNGQGYVTDSRISGDVDFMWGSGPCFFNNCDLTMLTSGGYFTQIRNGAAGHGYVFSNCRFTAPAGVTGAFLGRIDPAGFPNSEVVVLDSKFGDAANNAFLATATGVSGSNYLGGWWLLNNAATAAAAPNVHNWSNNLINATGAAFVNPNADVFTTMPLDATTQANYRSVPWVLGNNWNPALPPLIAAAPVAQTVNSGGSFTLSVQAFGIPALTYQWLRNGVPIAGANGPTYTVAAAGGADAGMYSVIVSNGTTSVTTTAVSLVVPGGAPVIALQPANTSGLLGTTATLNAWALGDAPFTYQWTKDGSPIAGATNLSLRLTGLQASDAGTYAVAITNAGGTTASNGAMLTIVAPANPVPALPQIPAGIFNVTAYGAVGDGATNNTVAIQAAINAAKAAGGGTVEFPPAAGAYLTGPITLGSHLNFQIDAGAIVRALPFGVYPNSNTSPSHFITIPNASTDVEFSGGGTIDGDGRPWWSAFDAGTISGRPRLVQINKSANMLFTGVTLLNSPNFNLAFSGANTNTTLFGVTIIAPGDSPNTDGMDLAGTNYLVQNCSVSVGDDNIVAKPGSVFCSNLYIANCTIGTGHGVSIGGQTNVGLDGMVVTNCTFNGTSSALRFKADSTQGGPVQNVTFSNLTMTNVQYPILFYSYYNVLGSPGATSGSSQITPAKVNAYNVAPPNSLSLPTIPTWKNITVTNLTVTNGSGYSTIWGLPTAAGLIASITLNNVTISGGAGLELYNAANIQLTGTTSVGTIVPCNALAITGQPVGKTINAGESVTFTSAAVGGSGTNNTGLTYQWKLGGTSLSDGVQADGSTIAGATTPTLTITNARVTNAGDYAVTVSTTLDGFDTSSSTLIANSLPVNATSSVASLGVNPNPATITLSDATVTYDGNPKAVTATTNPAGVAVLVTYNGSATAPSNAGTYAVVATLADANYVGDAVSATLVIQPATATVTLSDLNPTFTGAPLAATVTTAPAAVSVAVTYDGNAVAPTNAGSYAVVATVTDPNYTGSANDTLVINRAPVTITLSDLNWVYDGSPKAATITTVPGGVPVSVTYGGSLTAPINAGSYVVSATTADPNYIGSAGGTLVIGKSAVTTITLSPLTQAYDGTARVVTATTTPAGLPVNLTYDGAANAPIYPGVHTVVATIDDPNYVGTKTDSEVITITALVRHAPVLNGIIDGSAQVVLPENITLNSSASFSGDMLVPGTPKLQLNGSPALVGTREGPGAATPTNYTITLNSGAVLRYLVRHVNAIALPVVAAPPAPAGTRDVSINTAGQSPGNFATLRNLTLNASTASVAVPAGTYGTFVGNGSSSFVLGVAGSTQPTVYNLQSLTLNSSASVQIVGPVILTVANSVTLNGVAGNAAHPGWLVLNVASGGVTLNSHAALRAVVITPSGAVTLNGATLNGRVVADRLTLNGNALLDEVAP